MRAFSVAPLTAYSIPCITLLLRYIAKGPVVIFAPMKKTLLSAFFAVCLLANIHAGLLLYSETATISGSLGGTSFYNTLAVVTETAESSNATSLLNGYDRAERFNSGVVTISVSGFAPATFIDGTFGAFAINLGHWAGGDAVYGSLGFGYLHPLSFTAQSQITPLIGSVQQQNPAYDLTTPFSNSYVGGISPTSSQTTLGLFTLSKYVGDAVFTVTEVPAPSTDAVPEPSQVAASILLIGGIAGFVIVRRRKALGV